MVRIEVLAQAEVASQPSSVTPRLRSGHNGSTLLEEHDVQEKVKRSLSFFWGIQPAQKSSVASLSSAHSVSGC